MYGYDVGIITETNSTFVSLKEFVNKLLNYII